MRMQLLAMLLCLTAWGCRAAATPTPPAKPNVILIVIDTLRADHLSGYGYERKTSPVLDAFAVQNLKFDYAISTAPWTAPAVASIFTGLYPTAHGVGGHVDRDELHEDEVEASILDGAHETLAEAFGEAGYRTAGLTTNAWVADYLGFAQGFDVFETHEYESAGQLNRSAFELLDELAAEAEPFLLYLHYMDPHKPYRPPIQHLELFKAPLRRTPFVGSESRNLRLYDGEIHRVDEQIGKLFDRLRAMKLYRDAVIVVVSDHGEQFREHGDTGHDQNVYNYLVHVPLILKAPGLRGRVTETVSLVDIYPTLLELTGIPVDSQVQGISLLSSGLGSRAGVISEVTIGETYKGFTRPDGKKLILDFDAGNVEIVDPADERRTVGIFDIRRDYYEKESLDDPQLSESLRAGFYALYRDSVERRLNLDPEQALLSDETVRQLRALGYLE